MGSNLSNGDKIDRFCLSIEQEFNKAIDKGLIVGRPSLIIRVNSNVVIYVSNGAKYVSHAIACSDIVLTGVAQNFMAKRVFAGLMDKAVTDVTTKL